MTEKSPFEKLAVAIGDAALAVADDPVGAATKAAHQARGFLALGLIVVGQAAQTAGSRLMETPEPPAPSAPKPPTTATTAPAKKAPAKKAPAKKAPAKKAPAKKAAAQPPAED
jgi:hypothetical protein